MARDTNLNLRNQVIYQIYPRQYSLEGTFEAVSNDLDRIKDLGVDIIYFLPIHPIGFEGRKGVDGCAYSIKDYYGIADELGNLDDFKACVTHAHELGLKVMIDIVFNHTSRDSVLLETHPEWFFKREDGSPANRVGDWSDVADLTYLDKKQWTYMKDVLVYWAKIVDGFRCDVAPMVPLDFWAEAKEAVKAVKKEFIWLTESVHLGHIQYIRSLGYDCHSDSEMFQVFDICYDYDIDPYYHGYLKGHNSLKQYLDEVEKQEGIYPRNYIKLRAYENHDKERLYALLNKNDVAFYNMLALSFFLKGTPMLYNGVEVKSTKHLTLFDKDPINWKEHEDISPFLKSLITLKKHHLFKDGHMKFHDKENGAVISYTLKGETLVGIFNVEAKGVKNIPLIDGTYINRLTGKEVIIKNQTLHGLEPVVI
jgi:glycosidase